jgi:uncharacterized membrane protein YkoI
MVVNGQTIDVTAAEIEAGIVVGQTVKVHATATGANTWQAREVEVLQPSNATPPQAPVGGEFEVTGTLESIGSGFIVVSGQTISITSAEIKDPLLLGTLVKVHVTVVNGQLTAREIENADTDDDNENANTNANENVNSNDNNTNENLNGNENANTNDNTSGSAAVSAQQAIDIVLQVYPNTTIRSIELTTRFGGTLVWEIKIGNRIELNIDATTGAILTIDRPGDDDNQNANANQNGNDNNDDNGGMGSDDNGNQNDNGNDNNDDNGGDDNGGMGSDDGGGDDNGGMG